MNRPSGTGVARPAVLSLLLGLGVATMALVPTALPAAAAPASPYAVVEVDGASLSGITIAAPYALNPAFSPATTDYDVSCQAGSNQVSLTLTGNGGPITVSTNQQGTHSGASVDISLAVIPNQAIVIYAPNPGGVPGTAQYWVRCLPPDFPALQVNQAGPASPGWTPGYYFTGNLTSQNDGHYAMVLDGNGVPVWYQRLPGETGPSNVEPLGNDTIAWSPDSGPGFGVGNNISAYTGFDLSSQTTIASLPAAITPTDPHELALLPNGDRMMISTPLAAKNLSGLGNGAQGSVSAADNTVVDCVVQEVNPSNQAVWTWDAAPHIGLDEVNTQSGLPFAGVAWGLSPAGAAAADIYHCNSVAVDEDSSSPYFGDVLVSMRYLNAVLLIDRTTGDVIWKLGGTAFTANDPETAQDVPAQHLSITSDSETQFCGQHDARFVPTPNPAVEDVSVFDDHTGCVGAARGVEYALDTGGGTATPDWQYAQPQGHQTTATGSFRRMPDAANDIGSGTGVIGWGISIGYPSGITEVDGGGTVVYDVRFADGDALYRGIKVDPAQVNLSLLRQTAGWTGSTIPPPPPPPGPVSGGITLNQAILGMASTPSGLGYWQVASDGGVFNYGDAGFFGSAGGTPLNKPVVGIAATPDGGGYWLVASDGGVFSYGDAGFFGSAGGTPLNKPVVGLAATPDGGGYWLVASDGGVFSYGDAGFFGSAGGAPLNKPVVGVAATPDGRGYWLVASDGGVFSYGDAGFFGSAGGTPLNKPVVGIAATPDGGGYSLVASDGGVFSYGDAGFFGSAGGAPLDKPVVGVAAPPYGGGYWLVASDGGVFSYGDAGFFGSAVGP